jgi:hypothetical protein
MRGMIQNKSRAGSHIVQAQWQAEKPVWYGSLSVIYYLTVA